MKICVYTNHFYPEDFKVNDIAFELAKRGHEITVITALPDYPNRKKFRDYTLFKRSIETTKGVRIYRLPAIQRGSGKKIYLILIYLLYFVSVYVFAFFFRYKHKFDAIFVHHTSPFFFSLAAVLLKKKQEIPLFFWCLDLWPESLTAAAGINNPLILQPQIKMVQYVYNYSDKILISSKGFEQSICEKGDYKGKLEYFPNWAEFSSLNIQIPTGESLDNFPKTTSNDFVILFAGNIGVSQNIESILEAATKINKDNIKFIFLGDGRARSFLIDEVRRCGLEGKVFFPGRFPIEFMPYYMNNADVLLVSLKDEQIFNLTVPGKVQFYMAQGKPILAMLNGDGKELINDAKCGIAVPANDTNAFCNAVKELMSISKDELKEMGLRGKTYSEKHFTREQRMNQLCDLFAIHTDITRERINE